MKNNRGQPNVARTLNELKNNRGQLKIQQMAFMLIAVTIFFVMVGLLIVTLWISGLKGKAIDLQREQALLLGSKLANAPEFSCGEYFGNKRTNCVDLDKVILLKEDIDKYKDFWGISNVEIRKVYPIEEDIECTRQNYPNCNVINLCDEELEASESNFISICSKLKQGTEIYDNCDIGIMSLVYEAK